MKPSAVDYVAPTTLDEALSLKQGERGQVLAGGQGLLPLLARRRIAPDVLIDLRRLELLQGISVGDEGVSIKAIVTLRQLLDDPRIVQSYPALAQAARTVGVSEIRARATIGGTIVQRHPAGQILTAMAALNGRIKVASTAGRRTIGWQAFLGCKQDQGLHDDEILVSLELPAGGAAQGFSQVGRGVRVCACVATDTSSGITTLALGGLGGTVSTDPLPPTGSTELGEIAHRLTVDSTADDESGYLAALARVATLRALERVGSA